MPFSSNFTRVTLGVDEDTGDPALFVEGVSTPPDARRIFVALPLDRELLTAVVEEAEGATEWVATFRDVVPPFTVGDDVFVIGVARRPGPCDPFVWHGSFQITARADA